MKKKKATSADPTVAQLANLAVAIRRDRFNDPETLVKAAMRIWEAAQKLLAQPPPPPTPPPPQEKALPEPKRYPVELDEFLRLMLPHLTGKRGEKYKVFRNYLRFRLRNP